MPLSSSFLRQYAKKEQPESARPPSSGVRSPRIERSPVTARPRGRSTSKRVAAASAFSSSIIENGVWVKKWVDYSSKYGLGYILSNYSVGAYFNDSTKIISEPSGSQF